jgi:hypothetical protein
MSSQKSTLVPVSRDWHVCQLTYANESQGTKTKTKPSLGRLVWLAKKEKLKKKKTGKKILFHGTGG